MASVTNSGINGGVSIVAYTGHGSAGEIVPTNPAEQVRQLAVAVTASMQTTESIRQAALAEQQRSSAASEALVKRVNDILHQQTEEIKVLREALATAQKQLSDNVTVQQANHNATTATINAFGNRIAASETKQANDQARNDAALAKNASDISNLNTRYVNFVTVALASELRHELVATAARDNIRL